MHDDLVDSAGKLCTVWLRGGNLSSAPYRVTNRVATGRTDERFLQVKIQPKWNSKHCPAPSRRSALRRAMWPTVPETELPPMMKIFSCG